ncbi:MAG: TlpA family protein disulfide reductase [Alphaproteobacteria bacterium]|nr:TlpA family protein disulfide reductase [Alphaproteobacteria bacterium]
MSFGCECSVKITPNKTEEVASKTKENTEKSAADKQEIVSGNKVEEMTEGVAPEEVSAENAVKDVAPQQLKSEPESEKTKEEASQSKNVISEIIESISNAKISNLKRPFKDLPGYWEELGDFDVTITNAEANDEFPSEKFSLKSLKGNVVILFFTTTWCPNCIKVFQDLDKLSRALSNKNISNVKIIPLVLGMEEDDAVRKYYEDNKVVSLRRFKSLSPLFFNVIKAVPTCFVFNKKSVPVWGFSGATNYGAFEFLNFIEGLSKED